MSAEVETEVADATNKFCLAPDERLVDHPFVILAICSDPQQSWYVAADNPEKARRNYETYKQNWTTPLYRIAVAFDAEKLRADYALAAMPLPMSDRVH